VLSAADVVLVSLKQEITGAVPSKLYEAMASGKPIVLIARGEPGDIVRRNNAGFVVDPGDIQGLVGAIRTLLGDRSMRESFGMHGRDAAARLFDRSLIAQKFHEYLGSFHLTPAR